jgi:hypothetical protein
MVIKVVKEHTSPIAEIKTKQEHILQKLDALDRKVDSQQMVSSDLIHLLYELFTLMTC